MGRWQSVEQEVPRVAVGQIRAVSPRRVRRHRRSLHGRSFLGKLECQQGAIDEIGVRKVVEDEILAEIPTIVSFAENRSTKHHVPGQTAVERNGAAVGIQLRRAALRLFPGEVQRWMWSAVACAAGDKERVSWIVVLRLASHDCLWVHKGKGFAVGGV